MNVVNIQFPVIKIWVQYGSYKNATVSFLCSSSVYLWFSPSILGFSANTLVFSLCPMPRISKCPRKRVAEELPPLMSFFPLWSMPLFLIVSAAIDYPKRMIPVFYLAFLIVPEAALICHDPCWSKQKQRFWHNCLKTNKQNPTYWLKEILMLSAKQNKNKQKP